MVERYTRAYGVLADSEKEISQVVVSIPSGELSTGSNANPTLKEAAERFLQVLETPLKHDIFVKELV
jgi:hypothetical protein